MKIILRKTMIPKIGKAILVSLGAALMPPLLFGMSQRTLVSRTETEIYKLTYDDKRISTEEIIRCRLLALHYMPDTASPFFQGVDVRSKDGKLNFSKWFLSFPLEDCNPGYDECKTHKIDDKFFVNAQQNLNTNARKLQELRSLKIPRVLNPVRDYLAWSLEMTTKFEQTRFDYLRNGDPYPLAKLQCSVCQCENQAALLDDFRKVKEDRATWVRQTWQSRLILCLHAHDLGYPEEAWNRFLKQFGVKENFQLTSPL